MPARPCLFVACAPSGSPLAFIHPTLNYSASIVQPNRLGSLNGPKTKGLNSCDRAEPGGMRRVLLDQGLAPRAAKLLRAEGGEGLHVGEAGLGRAGGSGILG